MLLIDVLLNFSKYYVNEKAVNGYPFFLQPVLKRSDEKSLTIYSTCMNLKKGPVDQRNFKDIYEATQFQIQLIKLINALSDKESFHHVMDNVIVKNLFFFVKEATAGRFVCTGCGRTFRRIPLSRKCPLCKKEIKPIFSPMTFAKPLYTLKGLTDRIEDPIVKEKFLIALENIDMLTRVKKQTTIADFF